MSRSIKLFFLLFLAISLSRAQTGPGGVGNNSTNVLWVRAEDITGLNNYDNIQLWPDHSSHNNDLTQNNNSYNPVYRENYLNSFPVVQFKKNKNRIRKTNFNDFPTDKITAIYVTKNKENNDDGILSYASTADDDDFLIYGSRNLKPHIHHNFNSTGISLNDNNWHISQTSWKKYNGDLESWKDGSRDYTGTLSYSNGITPGGCFAIGADQDNIDDGYSNWQTHKGYMPEVILYNVYLNQAQHIIVGNYLSAKYDISLSANDFYTQDNNGDFDFNVAGIGQATDGSNHTDSQGSGIIRINNPSDLNNDEYLFWGENQKYATYDFTQVDAETYRVNTQWRVSKRNDLGNVSLSFDENDINLDTSVLKCAGLKLIVSNMSDFSNKTSYELNLNNGIYSVDNLDFTDGDYFSLEYSVNKTTWDGNAWSTSPGLNKKAYFNADYDTSTQNSVSVCSCEIASGKNLHITNGKYVEVQYDILNDGNILIETEGALVQHDNNSNISGNGTFQLNKTSMPLEHFYDYVYWSSPIVQGNLTLGDIHAGSWRYYKFDPTIINDPGQIYQGWVMLSSSDVVEAGMGYAISAPSNHTAGNSLSATFVKGNDPFNNGEITVNVYKRGGTNNYGDNNLLGNPYPSAIDFNQFASENPSLEGSYALWTKCAGLDANGHHQEGGYTVYTVSGGNGTATAACNGTGETASGYIASTQGFMINATTDNSTATFSNTQRVTGNNDNFLNRPANNRNVVWIDMLDHTGKYSQMAVGFYPDATDAYDRMYDAKNANSGNGFSLSSLLNNDQYVIQGLNQNNIAGKIIPLCVENDAFRNIRFHINRLEGFDGINIYLNDRQQQQMIDLKENDYTCPVDVGEIKNRFELVFSNILNEDEWQTEENTIIIRQNKDMFNIFTKNKQKINSVWIFEATGKLIYENRQVNATEIQIDLGQINTGNLLIFKVVTEDKFQNIKKVIKN